MKVQDIDVSKETIQVQEFVENIRNLLNGGAVEFEVTFSASPTVPAPSETKIVLSLFGATYRLYISYLSEWYYVGLTKL
jgi:hypothetical protein